MHYIGTYQNRKVYWFDYKNYLGKLPERDWVCLVTANTEPDYNKFERFIRESISNNVLEFKGHGKFGEHLHHHFDEVVSLMEVIEDHDEIDVMTTWHNDQTLADAFWECFFVTCLPNTADRENISVLVTDIDGIHRTYELAGYLQRFEAGWLPE